MSKIQSVGGAITSLTPQHDGVISWEIERLAKYRKVLGKDRLFGGRWFLRATVTIDLFSQLLAALKMVGVAEPWVDGGRNAPAVFKSMTRHNNLSESAIVAFELEAFDLRLIDRDQVEKGVDQGYFLE